MSGLQKEMESFIAAATGGKDATKTAVLSEAFKDNEYKRQGQAETLDATWQKSGLQEKYGSLNGMESYAKAYDTIQEAYPKNEGMDAVEKQQFRLQTIELARLNDEALGGHQSVDLAEKYKAEYLDRKYFGSDQEHKAALQKFDRDHHIGAVKDELALSHMTQEQYAAQSQASKQYTNAYETQATKVEQTLNGVRAGAAIADGADYVAQKAAAVGTAVATAVADAAKQEWQQGMQAVRSAPEAQAPIVAQVQPAKVAVAGNEKDVIALERQNLEKDKMILNLEKANLVQDRKIFELEQKFGEQSKMLASQNKAVQEMLDKNPAVKDKVAQKDAKTGATKEPGDQGFDFVAMIEMLMKMAFGNSTGAAQEQAPAQVAAVDTPKPKNPKAAGMSVEEGATALVAAANENVLKPVVEAVQKFDKDHNITGTVKEGIAAMKDAATQQFQENAASIASNVKDTVGQAAKAAQEFAFSFTSPAMEKQSDKIAKLGDKLDNNIADAMKELNGLSADKLDKSISAATKEMDDLAKKMGLEDIHAKLGGNPVIKELGAKLAGVGTNPEIGNGNTNNIRLMAGGPGADDLNKQASIS